MKYYGVSRCDEFCPFYEKDIHVYERELMTCERCILLGYDYSDPKQVLVRLWAGRRREVEDSYKHVRIADRPDIDEVFPPVPDFCPVKNGPVLVRFQPVKWRRWEGKAFLVITMETHRWEELRSMFRPKKKKEEKIENDDDKRRK
jgi:hypothetical protein